MSTLQSGLGSGNVKECECIELGKEQQMGDLKVSPNSEKAIEKLGQKDSEIIKVKEEKKDVDDKGWTLSST